MTIGAHLECRTASSRLESRSCRASPCRLHQKALRPQRRRRRAARTRGARAAQSAHHLPRHTLWLRINPHLKIQPALRDDGGARGPLRRRMDVHRDRRAPAAPADDAVLDGLRVEARGPRGLAGEDDAPRGARVRRDPRAAAEDFEARRVLDDERDDAAVAVRRAGLVRAVEERVRRRRREDRADAYDAPSAARDASSASS